MTDKEQEELKVGDIVRDIYTHKEGIVINAWDGKYTVSYSEGERYNPYRIMVEINHPPDVSLEFYIENHKAEHLEKIDA